MRRDEQQRTLAASCLAAAGLATTQLASAEYVPEVLQPVFVTLGAAVAGAA